MSAHQEFINKLKDLPYGERESIFLYACLDNDVTKIKCILEDESIKLAHNVDAMAHHGFFNAALHNNKELADYYLYSPTLKENLTLEHAIVVLINYGELNALEFALENYKVEITQEIEDTLHRHKDSDVAKFFTSKQLTNSLQKDLKEKDKQIKVKL